VSSKSPDDDDLVAERVAELVAELVADALGAIAGAFEPLVPFFGFRLA
jgi:hypothetical protein